MDKRILVINPGSTSTKLALFQGEQKLFDAAVRHSKEDLSPFSWVMEQADFRQTAIEKELSAHNVDLTTLDAVCARGGQLPYCAAGTYLVDQDMVDFMYTVRDAAHASPAAGFLKAGVSPVRWVSPPLSATPSPWTR